MASLLTTPQELRLHIFSYALLIEHFVVIGYYDGARFRPKKLPQFAALAQVCRKFHDEAIRIDNETNEFQLVLRCGKDQHGPDQSIEQKQRRFAECCFAFRDIRHFSLCIDAREKEEMSQALAGLASIVRALDYGTRLRSLGLHISFYVPPSPQVEAVLMPLFDLRIQGELRLTVHLTSEALSHTWGPRYRERLETAMRLR